MGIKIKIVDQKEADYAQLMHFFAQSGHQVSFVSSWKKCIKQFKREKPDILFLSPGLPHLGGLDALHKIRKNGDAVDLFAVVDSRDHGIDAVQSDSSRISCPGPSSSDSLPVWESRLPSDSCQGSSGSLLKARTSSRRLQISPRRPGR